MSGLSGGATFGYSKIPTYTVRTEDDVAQGVKHVHVTIVDMDSMDLTENTIADLVPSDFLPSVSATFNFMVPLPVRGQSYTLRLAEMIVTSDYNNHIRDPADGAFLLRPPFFNIDCDTSLADATIQFAPFAANASGEIKQIAQPNIPINTSVPGPVPTPFGSYVSRNAAWIPLTLRDSSQTYDTMQASNPETYITRELRGFPMRYIRTPGKMIINTTVTDALALTTGCVTIALHFEFRPLTEALVR